MNALIGMPQGAEWLVILAIVVLVFGAAKLPDLARGTGQALRIARPTHQLYVHAGNVRPDCFVAITP